MEAYTDQDRKNDFYFYLNHHTELFKRYGHSYVAIKNGKIIGVCNSVKTLIDNISIYYKFGTYSVQECTGDESGYTTVITGVKI